MPHKFSPQVNNQALKLIRPYTLKDDDLILKYHYVEFIN